MEVYCVHGTWQLESAKKKINDEKSRTSPELNIDKFVFISLKG